MSVYYNEIDPYCCQWLKNLMAMGLIPYGDVDGRDIQDIKPSEVAGYRQCHFFAGLGGWAYALQLAEWGDEPVWTGSCPCQPFSTAGKRKGAADERHLWPAWFHLIAECRPSVVFGEQVASKDGLAWFDLVSTDLEGTDYAIGASDLCAASVGAPHIRQRLWFVADSQSTRRVVGHAHDAGSQGWDFGRNGTYERTAWASGVDGGMAVSNGRVASNRDLQRSREQRLQSEGCWSDVTLLPCRDGKTRPTKPGLFPLVDGVPARIQQLRAAGNAIVPQVAAEFIKAYRDL